MDKALRYWTITAGVGVLLLSTPTYQAIQKIRSQSETWIPRRYNPSVKPAERHLYGFYALNSYPQGKEGAIRAVVQQTIEHAEQLRNPAARDESSASHLANGRRWLDVGRGK